jgi:hypothetical protein
MSRADRVEQSADVHLSEPPALAGGPTVREGFGCTLPHCARAGPHSVNISPGPIASFIDTTKSLSYLSLVDTY